MRSKSVAIIAAMTLTLSACAPSAPEAEVPFDGITIVASTNVWADIARSVGGDLVQVTSIIDSFSQDPHSYEASARDQLAVNNADLVLANGGGYDSFMDTLAKAADARDILYAYVPEFLAAEDAQKSEEEPAGHNHDHADGNEHVWYDFHVVEDFATRIMHELSRIDPANYLEYEANLTLFLDEIEILEDRVAVLSSSSQGKSVISTEPVADYLLDELELINITPASFSQAIEEEIDVSPKALLEIENLIKNGAINLFVVNPQTTSSQIDLLVAIAKENGIQTVELSELLPEGIRYFEWMDANITAIELGLK